MFRCRVGCKIAGNRPLTLILTVAIGNPTHSPKGVTLLSRGTLKHDNVGQCWTKKCTPLNALVYIFIAYKIYRVDYNKIMSDNYCRIILVDQESSGQLV